MIDHPNPHLYFSAPVAPIPLLPPNARNAVATLSPTNGSPLQLLPSVRTALRSSASAYFTQSKKLADAARDCMVRDVPFRLKEPAATLLPHLQVFTMKFEVDWLMKDVGYFYNVSPHRPFSDPTKKTKTGAPPVKRVATTAINGNAASLRQEGFLDGEVCAQSLAQWVGYQPPDGCSVPLQFQIEFITHLSSVLSESLVPMVTASVLHSASTVTTTAAAPLPASASFSTAATGLSPAVERALSSAPIPANGSMITVKQRFTGQQESAVYLTIATLRTIAAFVHLWSHAQKPTSASQSMSNGRSGREHLARVVGSTATSCLFPTLLFSQDHPEQAAELDAKAGAIADALLAVPAGSVTTLIGPLLRSILRCTTFGLEYVNARREDSHRPCPEEVAHHHRKTNITPAMLRRADFIIWTLSPAPVMAMLVRHSAVMALFALTSSEQGAAASRVGQWGNETQPSAIIGNSLGSGALAEEGSTTSRVLADQLFSYHWTALFPVGVSPLAPPELHRDAAATVGSNETVASAASLSSSRTTRRHHPLFAPLMFDHYRRVSILVARVLSCLVEGSKNRLVVAAEPPVLATNPSHNNSTALGGSFASSSSFAVVSTDPLLGNGANIRSHSACDVPCGIDIPSLRLAPGSLTSQSHTSGFAVLAIHEALIAAIEMQRSEREDEWLADVSGVGPWTTTTSQSMLCWDNLLDTHPSSVRKGSLVKQKQQSPISTELHLFKALLSGTYRCLLLQELMRIVAAVGEYSSYSRLPESSRLLLLTCLDQTDDESATAGPRRKRALLRSFLRNQTGLKELNEQLQTNAVTYLGDVTNESSSSGKPTKQPFPAKGEKERGGASGNSPIAYVFDSEYLIACDFLHLILVTLHKTRTTIAATGGLVRVTGMRHVGGPTGGRATTTPAAPRHGAAASLTTSTVSGLSHFADTKDSKHSLIRLALDVIHGGVVTSARNPITTVLTPGTGRLLSLLAREAPWALTYKHRSGHPSQPGMLHSGTHKKYSCAWGSLLEMILRTVAVAATKQKPVDSAASKAKPALSAVEAVRQNRRRVEDSPSSPLATTAAAEVAHSCPPVMTHVGMTVLAAVEGMNALFVVCQRDVESVADFAETAQMQHILAERAARGGASDISSIASRSTHITASAHITQGAKSKWSLDAARGKPPQNTWTPFGSPPLPTASHNDPTTQSDLNSGTSSVVDTATPSSEEAPQLDPHTNKDDLVGGAESNGDDSWSVSSSGDESGGVDDEEAALLASEDAGWLAERQEQKEVDSVLRAAERLEEAFHTIVFPIIDEWISLVYPQSIPSAATTCVYPASVVVTALRFLALLSVPVEVPATGISEHYASALVTTRQRLEPLFQRASSMITSVVVAYDNYLCGEGGRLLLGWFPVWTEMWAVVDYFLIETARRHTLAVMNTRDRDTNNHNFGDHASARDLWGASIRAVVHTITPEEGNVTFSIASQQDPVITRCVLPTLRTKAASTFTILTERTFFMEAAHTARIAREEACVAADTKILDEHTNVTSKERAVAEAKARVWQKDQIKRMKPGAAATYDVGPCTDRSIVLAMKHVEAKEVLLQQARERIETGEKMLDILRETPIFAEATRGESFGQLSVLIVSEGLLQQLMDVGVFIMSIFNTCTQAQQVGSLFATNSSAAREAAIHSANLFAPSPLPPTYLPIGEADRGMSPSEGPEMRAPEHYALSYVDSIFKRHIPHYFGHARYTSVVTQQTSQSKLSMVNSHLRPTLHHRRPPTTLSLAAGAVTIGGGSTISSMAACSGVDSVATHDSQAAVDLETVLANVPSLVLLLGPSVGRSDVNRPRVMLQTHLRTAWLMCVPSSAPLPSTRGVLCGGQDTTMLPVRALYPLSIGVCTAIPTARPGDAFTMSASGGSPHNIRRVQSQASFKSQREDSGTSPTWEPFGCGDYPKIRGDALEVSLHSVSSMAISALKGLALLSSAAVPVDYLISMLPTADPLLLDAVIASGDPLFRASGVASMVAATTAAKLLQCRLYSPLSDSNAEGGSRMNKINDQRLEAEVEEEDWLNEGLTAFLLNQVAKGMVGDRIRRECMRTFPDTLSTQSSATTYNTTSSNASSTSSSRVSTSQSAKFEAWRTRKERGVGVVVPSAQLQQRFTVEALLADWQKITPLYLRIASIDALGVILSRRDLFLTDSQAAHMAIKCLLLTLGTSADSLRALHDEGLPNPSLQRALGVALHHCASSLLSIHQECLEVVSDKKFAAIIAARISGKLPEGWSSPTSDETKGEGGLNALEVEAVKLNVSPYRGIPVVHRPASLGAVIEVVSDALNALDQISANPMVHTRGRTMGSPTDIRAVRIEAQRLIEVIAILGKAIRKWMGVSLGSKEVQAVALSLQGTAAQDHLSLA